jgi:hypothetical protein
MGKKVWIFLLAALLVPGTSAWAQQAAPGQDIVSITAFGGGLFPTGDLGAGEFDNSGTGGVTAGIWLGRYVGIRGNVLFARTDVNGGVPAQLVGSNPDVWLYSADLLLRYPIDVGAGWLSPYAIGGLGGKTHDFSGRGTETDFAGNFGAGLEYRFGPTSRWGIYSEVRDFVSRFERYGIRDTQHDVVWTGGVSLNF